VGQVAPSSWISIFGDRLATKESAESIYPYPATRAGATVWLGGTRLPLSYASSGVVNALVPYSATADTRESVAIQRENTLSAPFKITVVDAIPAIYTINGQGFGQGAIVHAATGALVANDPTFPGAGAAARGEYLAIFCSGLGAVDNPPSDNQPAPITPPFSTLKAHARVTIGGVDAVVTYVGLAPGQVGLYQINAQVPTSAPSGDEVEVQVIVGDALSNVANIAIK
jgi:uncharacterized protein (TIGR03437 family)